MVILFVFSPSSKCSLFHNSNVFGSCIIHILYTGCAKIKKKNNSGAKRLMLLGSNRCLLRVAYVVCRVRKFQSSYIEQVRTCKRIAF